MIGKGYLMASCSVETVASTSACKICTKVSGDSGTDDEGDPRVRYYSSSWFWQFAAEDSGIAHLSEEMKRLEDAGITTIARSVSDTSTTRALRFVCVTCILACIADAAGFRGIMQDLTNWRQSVTAEPVFTLKMQRGEVPDTFSVHKMYQNIPEIHRTANGPTGWTMARTRLVSAVPGLAPSMDTSIGDLDAVISAMVTLQPQYIRFVFPAPLSLSVESEPIQSSVSSLPNQASVSNAPMTSSQSALDTGSAASEPAGRVSVGMLPVAMHNVDAGVKVRDMDGKVSWDKGLKAKILDLNFKTQQYFESERFISLGKEIAPDVAFVGGHKSPTWLHYRVAQDIAQEAGVPDETKRALDTLTMGERGRTGSVNTDESVVGSRATLHRGPASDDTVDATLTEFAHLVFITRPEDGFVNITRMCASIISDKTVTWDKYNQTLHGKTYIQSVLQDLNMQGWDSVVRSQRGGLDTDCTWVHPRVAIGVAAWGDPRAGKATLRIAVRHLFGETTTEESQRFASTIRAHLDSAAAAHVETPVDGIGSDAAGTSSSSSGTSSGTSSSVQPVTPRSNLTSTRSSISQFVQTLVQKNKKLQLEPVPGLVSLRPDKHSFQLHGSYLFIMGMLDVQSVSLLFVKPGASFYGEKGMEARFDDVQRGLENPDSAGIMFAVPMPGPTARESEECMGNVFRSMGNSFQLGATEKWAVALAPGADPADAARNLSGQLRASIPENVPVEINTQLEMARIKAETRRQLAQIKAETEREKERMRIAFDLDVVKFMNS